MRFEQLGRLLLQAHRSSGFAAEGPIPLYKACEALSKQSSSEGWMRSVVTLQSTCRGLHTCPALQQEFVSLNNLADNPGARKQVKRLGRGIGSGLGKTSGRGHKGQKARRGRQVKLGFEGGQTPLRLSVPKQGFHQHNAIRYAPLNLGRLQSWVDIGRLDASHVITMKELRDSGAVRRQVGNGIKLLAQGARQLQIPVHLQVSQVSAEARKRVEAMGGSVTTVYYNALGLRALLRPDWFTHKGRLTPKPAQAPPKLATRFDARGCLPSVADPKGASWQPAGVLPRPHPVVRDPSEVRTSL
ncbi:hypothetical protein WJX73_002904 [Symbiochloris irregularis]|uniref:Large ribosomal subunit protein uL15/eL18 domain-containing protein n=1 Tax=Symbiochloris irregularis TaxID=706552 RepID=A0AAW1NPE9_9CHLO